MKAPPRQPRCRQGGFSYVEVLVAVSLVAVCLVPAIDALRTGLAAPAAREARFSEEDALSSTLEQVLSRSFESLDAAATAAGGPDVPTSYSAAPISVYLARYDADNADGDDDPFTGGDSGLLWVKVTYAGRAGELVTLTGP